MQFCDLETMVSRLECTRVHFLQVSVSVSRPEGPGLGLGVQTRRPRSRSWSEDSVLGAYACSTIAVICSTFKRVLCHQLELMQPVM